MKKKLLLHFDVNGTLILRDSSKVLADDSYGLLSALAENTVLKWDPDHEPMSFKDYAYRVLCPGDKNDASVKQKRQEIIGRFLKYLEAVDTDEHARVSEMVRENQGRMMAGSIFLSFHRLLTRLQQQGIPFTILLRTFGNDLADVVREMQAMGLQFGYGKFVDGKLSVGDGRSTVSNRTIERPEEMFHLFLHSKHHWAIQDDWQRWSSHGEKGEFGKPFVYDADERESVSFFFDDNVTGEEMDIVAPVDVSGKGVTPEREVLCRVNTLEALTDPDYYVRKVLK